jgi:hypothetical protein
MDYFKQLMEKILHYASSYGATNTTGKGGSLRTRLLEVLYKLLMIDAVPIKQLTSERENLSPLDEGSGAGILRRKATLEEEEAMNGTN